MITQTKTPINTASMKNNVISMHNLFGALSLFNDFFKEELTLSIFVSNLLTFYLILPINSLFTSYSFYILSNLSPIYSISS